MKRLLLVLFVLAIIVFAVGLYRGWFRLASESADNTSNITLTVDKDKIEQDKDKAIAAVQDFGEQARDKAGATTQKAQDETPAGVQPPPRQE
jgi:hypothetical protein